MQLKRTILKILIPVIGLFSIGFVVKEWYRKPLVIVPVIGLNTDKFIEIDGKKLHYKSDCYLLKNYRDDKQSRRLLDSFVKVNRVLNIEEYTQYNMCFYKESHMTTVKTLVEERVSPYSLEHDFIYDYHWSKGKLLACYKMKNGLIIEPKGNEIILSPAPE
jgi:hypothetical protein